MENKEFITSKENKTVGGHTELTDQGIISTSTDNSQVYIQNGVIGARNPDGTTEWTLEDKLNALEGEVATLKMVITGLQYQLQTKKENE